jgi:hypothetical protein
VCLAYCPPVVRDRAESERDDDGVEAQIGRIERLSVSLAQVRLAAELAGAPLRQVHHRVAELNAGQPYVRRVVGQVASGPNGYLENVAVGLGADPGAPVAEQHALEERDLAVVSRRPLVLNAANTFVSTCTAGLDAVTSGSSVALFRTVRHSSPGCARMCQRTGRRHGRECCRDVRRHRGPRWLGDQRAGAPRIAGGGGVRFH